MEFYLLSVVNMDICVEIKLVYCILTRELSQLSECMLIAISNHETIDFTNEK
jgi:hypothetical protein